MRTDEHGHEDEAVELDAVVALDAVVVESTRSRRRVSEEPIHVEVLEREEIEEKLLMTPGNIAMAVAETGGVRVQSTSPALGAAGIRIHGMRGRYTQLLADGLPLYGGQASSIGLLQIPPTDLGRVEIIKGAASMLYGPSAPGGVINLISRRPGGNRETELLLNATRRDGQDVTGYTASPLGELELLAHRRLPRAGPARPRQRRLDRHAGVPALDRAAAPVLELARWRQGAGDVRRDGRRPLGRHARGRADARRAAVPVDAGHHAP